MEEPLMQAVVDRANESVPKAKPPCPRCRGKGSYHEPPLEEQRRQLAEGARKITTMKVCTCILDGVK